jgi:hypothetical protein
MAHCRILAPRAIARCHTGGIAAFKQQPLRRTLSPFSAGQWHLLLRAIQLQLLLMASMM